MRENKTYDMPERAGGGLFEDFLDDMTVAAVDRATVVDDAGHPEYEKYIRLDLHHYEVGKNQFAGTPEERQLVAAYVRVNEIFGACRFIDDYYIEMYYGGSLKRHEDEIDEEVLTDGENTCVLHHLKMVDAPMGDFFIKVCYNECDMHYRNLEKFVLQLFNEDKKSDTGDFFVERVAVPHLRSNVRNPGLALISPAEVYKIQKHFNIDSWIRELKDVTQELLRPGDFHKYIWHSQQQDSYASALTRTYCNRKSSAGGFHILGTDNFPVTEAVCDFIRQQELNIIDASERGRSVMFSYRNGLKKKNSPYFVKSKEDVRAIVDAWLA